MNGFLLLAITSYLITSVSSYVVNPALGTRTKIEIPSTSDQPNNPGANNCKIDRIPFHENGYNTWKWRGHDINYIEKGNSNAPGLLLLHGFGASSYHWRHNIPDLAQDYHVYAFDMLGFGQSSKPVEEYSMDVWKDQTLDFVSQVIGKPTTIAGNSLGGFTALYAAAAEGAKNLIKGCILLNAAGRFRRRRIDNNNDMLSSKEDADGSKMKSMERIFAVALHQGMKRHNENFLAFWTTEKIQRAIIKVAFNYYRRSSTIEQVLKKAYFKTDNVDDELIKSICTPSEHPNAADVFYRMFQANHKGHAGQAVPYVEDLLAKLEIPLLLCWGEMDPSCTGPAHADAIQSLYPRTTRVNIEAGHCPHDESPKEVNSAIRMFLQTHVLT